MRFTTQPVGDRTTQAICTCAVFTVACAFMSANAFAATWFVDIDATGANNGTSWTDAFTTIQPAIDAASATDEVWVAEGTYGEVRVSPGVDGNPANADTGSLIMKDGVDIYAGFVGSETLRSQRDFLTNLTVIDGSTSRGGGCRLSCYCWSGRSVGWVHGYGRERSIR